MTERVDEAPIRGARKSSLPLRAATVRARHRAGKPPPRLDLEEYLPYLINRTGATLAVAFSQDLRAMGLTLPMWRVIAILSHGGTHRQIDLAKRASIEESTLSRLITTLHRKNVVTRRRSTMSNREVSVSLTEKGAKMAAILIPRALASEAVLTRGIEPKDLATVRRCLRKFYENLDRATLVAPDHKRRPGGARRLP